jgi:replicative DNA helicase
MSAVMSALDEVYGADPQIAQLRIPPHSIEGESSVLGGLLLDNGAWDRVSDLLSEGDFYRYEHRLVYAASIRWPNTCPARAISVAMPRSCVSVPFCESW